MNSESIMEKQKIRPKRRATAPDTPHTPLRLKLLQIAGGDAAFEAKLREMIWQEYCDAEWPYGPTEEGMFLWLEHQQASVV